MEDSLLPDTALEDDFVGLTVDIVAAYVSNNSVSVTEVAALVSNVYKAVAALDEAPRIIAAPPKPAVTIRASVKPDYLICLEDGHRVRSDCAQRRQDCGSCADVAIEQYRK